jgi:hypothetical protein
MTKRTPQVIKERYVVEVRGRQYWVVDSQTRGLMGGPFAFGPEGRMAAMARADTLNSTLVQMG